MTQLHGIDVSQGEATTASVCFFESASNSPISCSTGDKGMSSLVFWLGHLGVEVLASGVDLTITYSSCNTVGSASSTEGNESLLL